MTVKKKPQPPLPQVVKVDGEVLTSLCESCKCCLAKAGHCWICHTTIPIERLCGCDRSCADRVEDFAEREAERIRARQFKSSTRALLNRENTSA